MEKDKFKAVWLSHSSIRDFLNCPRLYYLRNIYRDPITKHKITVVTPALTFGLVMHSVIDGMSMLPASERKDYPLIKKFETEWGKSIGKKGGFLNHEQEQMYLERGRAMMKRIVDNEGPLLEKAVKIPEELPYYWLSEEDNLILSGKIDWLIYKEETNSVHILDFKTGKSEEDADSLQLPIYYLVVTNTQGRAVSGASYWYLYKDDAPKEVKLPDPVESKEKILSIGMRIKLARQLEHFTCKSEGGCKFCEPLESVLKGKGEKVGVSSYNQDLYILPYEFKGKKESPQNPRTTPTDTPY